MSLSYSEVIVIVIVDIIVKFIIIVEFIVGELLYS